VLAKAYQRLKLLIKIQCSNAFGQAKGSFENRTKGGIAQNRQPFGGLTARLCGQSWQFPLQVKAKPQITILIANGHFESAGLIGFNDLIWESRNLGAWNREIPKTKSC
jgi:hypothetical protein